MKNPVLNALILLIVLILMQFLPGEILGHENDTLQNFKKCVVRIDAGGEPATGFIYEQNYQDKVYILTCHHVVKELSPTKPDLNVYFWTPPAATPKKPWPAEILAKYKDTEIDLAIIVVNDYTGDPITKAEYSKFNNQNKLQVIGHYDESNAWANFSIEPIHSDNDNTSVMFLNKKIGKGFSGAAVYDNGKIIGMIVENVHARDKKLSRMLKSEIIESKLNIIYPRPFRSKKLLFKVKEKDGKLKETVNVKFEIEGWEYDKSTHKDGDIILDLSDKVIGKTINYSISESKKYKTKNGTVKIRETEIQKPDIILIRKERYYWDKLECHLLGGWFLLTLLEATILFYPKAFDKWK